MRHIAILLALASSALADEASDLFYRAFWLEQSGGDVAEAERLYGEVVEKHAKAPEAPRAILAIIRLRAARGENVDRYVAKLGDEYPGAKKEIEQARRIAARQNVAFDAQVGPDDSPLERKLKAVYRNLVSSGKRGLSDIDFLVDVGAAAHPMLAAALRSAEEGAAYYAAVVLTRQKSADADDVLLRALRDENVLYRLRIVDALLSNQPLRPAFLAGLAELWPRASRSLRIRITKVWVQQSRGSHEAADDAHRLLALALRDDAPGVRIEALAISPQPPYDIPVEWTRAALEVLPVEDARARTAGRMLPWQVRREEIRAAVEEELIAREEGFSFQYPSWQRLEEYRITEPMARSWARIALARAATRPDIFSSQDNTKGLVYAAAAGSKAVARELLAAGLERGDRALLGMVVNGARPTGRESLGDLSAIRRLAIAQWYEGDEGRRDAANFVFGLAPPEPADLPALLKAAKAHPEAGLPAHAMTGWYLKAIGSARAAELVPLAPDDAIEELLTAGFSVPTLVYWKAILPRTTARHAALLQKAAARGGPLAVAVARRILDARGEGWQWRTSAREPRRYNVAGPMVLNQVADALQGPELRPALYAAAADERYEIGLLAIRAASRDGSDAALEAHRVAMKSPWPDLRERAIKSLGNRGPEGAAVVASFLRDPEFPDVHENDALTAFSRSAGPAQMAYVRQRLDARPEGYEASVMWSVAFEHDRDATVERAFREVFGDGPKDFRDEALDVLREISDERRIPVFRKVLREDRDEARVHRVLNTVADQYLIELGPEVLLHLRNPGDGIRKTATKAIERLRFYAEAKRLFEGE